MPSEQSVSCSLGMWRSALLLLLPLLLVQLAATQRAGECSSECVPLQECPELLQLLRSNESESINVLQKATCSFNGKDPLVCCTQAKAEPGPILLPKNCGQSSVLHKIIGGTRAIIGDYRWMAVLGFTEGGSTKVEFLCGGAVINERYVLTAAHCVHPSVIGTRRLELIRLGELDLTTEVDCHKTLLGKERCAAPAQNFTYEEIIPHPDYNTRAQFSDDIALIRLSRPIDLSGQWIHPVCLPPQGLDARKAAGKQEPEVAGWGFTETGKDSETLLHVSLPFLDNEQCSSAYNVTLVDGQMCLGGRAGQDSCAGDSGGPLMVSGPQGPPFLLIGVVSYGPIHCGQEGKPAVYTSVSHYLNWILQNLKA